MATRNDVWRRRNGLVQLFIVLSMAANAGLSIQNYYETDKFPYAVLAFMGIFCAHIIVFPMITKLSPLHIWRIWWGYDVQCSFAGSSYSPENLKLNEEAFEWAKKKSKGAVHHRYHGKFQFFRKSDAMHFRLVWG